MKAILRIAPVPAVVAWVMVTVAGCGADERAASENGSAPAETTVSTLSADWCAGHGVPESACTICNPDLIPGFKNAGDWCEEHGLPESVCPQCGAAPPRAGAAGDPLIAPGTRIRFRTPELESAAGIRVVRVREVGMGDGVACAARIDFDRNRSADIRAPFPGLVREVLVDLGERVVKGAPLFVLESSQVGDLRAAKRAARKRVEVAHADYERHVNLHESDLVSSRDLDLSRQELEAARSELAAAEAAIDMAGPADSLSRQAGGRYTLQAPIEGIVARRPAIIGTFAGGETSLATVADTRLMWAVLEIPEADASRVGIGQQVDLTVDGLPERAFRGVVTWIAAEVDPVTRTVEARAEIHNPARVLRAKQFARAIVEIAEQENAVAVPVESVQRIGEESVVFLRAGEGLYEPRSVRVLRRSRGLVQLTGSVKPGDEVVAEGAYLLRTELTRESIGAGCCEIEPVAER